MKNYAFRIVTINGPKAQWNPSSGEQVYSQHRLYEKAEKLLLKKVQKFDQDLVKFILQERHIDVGGAVTYIDVVW
jgi:hypothetical protein